MVSVTKERTAYSTFDKIIRSSMRSPNFKSDFLGLLFEGIIEKVVNLGITLRMDKSQKNLWIKKKQ